MKISGIIPQLRTMNLEGSILFYTTQLGLELAFRHEDFYAGIRAGTQLFHLKYVCEEDPSIAYTREGEHFHLYLQTDDAAALAEALKARGVNLTEEVHETLWNTKEFVIEDDQGHTIYFGEAL
ncbi:glyoxalase/bleomycin resistance protein/dioxygenase superfamily protein [Paenibacillus taihuensis]|uniref:Glyoxalase/bleomycin resistance protein/dioxygenase superfamily protein n=1 Tax=Paenibacillus taihuensis TaxID=1156355 RepID=A0A3D9RHI4_9BACL|nr:VOC family protein [Paenibacillus taihuensis]REE78549.1 glyoxalase/bleomycin resistance protein/dioxygenase superfamily protein [Paenibacillus taihuensis]